MKKKSRFLINTIFLTLPFILVDSFTKIYAIREKDNIYCMIKDVFCFKYRENTGIAFSIPIPILIITILNILLLGLILKLANDELKKNRFTLVAISLIVAGGIGNLIDRFARGFVVDFISIFNFPIFNVADICISLGVLIIIVFYGKIKR